MASDEAIDTFKREINLVEYASACGYALLKQESSRSSAVMRSVNGDKIVIAKSPHQHWIYFSVHDSSDNGTIVDFVLRRRAGNNFGRMRQELHGWLRGTVLPDRRQPELQLALTPASKDRQRVLRMMHSMALVEEHRYLLSRGLPRAVTASPRFQGKILVDGRSNAVFPHYDEEGICGFEVKNRGFTGFAPGGERGLWRSNPLASDTAIVLAESAIDALSYFGVGQTPARYFSTGGAWGSRTAELIQHEVARFPAPAKVILAFDNDKQGHQYVRDVQEILAAIPCEIITDLPPAPGTDWNDFLRTFPPSPSPGMPPNALQKPKERA